MGLPIYTTRLQHVSVAQVRHPHSTRSSSIGFNMKYLAFLAAVFAVAPSVLAAPRPAAAAAADVNPYLGVQPYAPKSYAKKLEETIKYFEEQEDELNAGRTRTVQKVPTFAWVSRSADVTSHPYVYCHSLRCFSRFPASRP